MNLQRLKFAWARGARIQVQIKPEFDRGFDWTREYGCPATVADMNLTRYNWRIHPADEHLQYGPLSSALRKRALYWDWCGAMDRDVHEWYRNDAFGDEFDNRSTAGTVVDRFAMLFYAEYLADQGL
jgi:hypothetical protein